MTPSEIRNAALKEAVEALNQVWNKYAGDADIYAPAQQAAVAECQDAIRALKSSPAPEPEKAEGADDIGDRPETISRNPQSWAAWKREAEDEKRHRIYYQDIVYSVCCALDRIHGRKVSLGEGIICGTANSPSKAVQKEMNRLVETNQRLRLEVNESSTPAEEVKPAPDKTEGVD